MAVRSVFLTADSPGHVRRFLDHLTDLSGFICMGSPSPVGPGSEAWISAEPIRPVRSPLCTATTLSANIKLAMEKLDPDSRVAGMIDYDMAYGLEQALKTTQEPWSPYPFRAAVYSWWIELGPEPLSLRLCLTKDCDAGLPDRLLALLKASREKNDTALFRASGFTAETSHKDYLNAVSQVQEYILNGDCYQVNLSHRFGSAYNGPLWQAFCALCDQFPSPHSGFTSLNGETVLSISPESFLEIKAGRMRTRPIKGTRPRGTDEASDRRLGQELKDSAKDRAENLMIVDLLRNDLGKFSETGSVKVDALMALESFRNVHHLVSTVSSRLKAGVSPFEAFLGCFPGGSITGAPKLRAMEIIAELEAAPRGPYCGSLFWLDGNGELYSNIAIRTLYARGGTLYCHGGGGVVADSEPEAEYQETLVKVGPLMDALTRLNQPER